MLGKLIKYDLKSLRKQLFGYYIVVIIASILSRISYEIQLIWKSFSIICVPIWIVFVILLVGSIIYTFYISIKRYYKNIYKEEGYLTNTLPVSKIDILLAKDISSMIFFILSLIVIIIASLISFKDLDKLFKLITDTYSNYSILMIVGSLIIIVSYLFYLTIIHLAISLGHRHNSNKIALSIVYGIIIYIITQIVNLGELGIIYKMHKFIFINNITPSIPVLTSILLLSLIFTSILTIIYCLINNYILKNKFNIE